MAPGLEGEKDLDGCGRPSADAARLRECWARFTDGGVVYATSNFGGPGWVRMVEAKLTEAPAKVEQSDDDRAIEELLRIQRIPTAKLDLVIPTEKFEFYLRKFERTVLDQYEEDGAGHYEHAKSFVFRMFASLLPKGKD